MRAKIGVIRGDGIGPEVVGSALEVLRAVSRKFHHNFEEVELLAGGCSIDTYGEPLTAQTLERARQCDAVLLGAVGGPKWDSLPGAMRPERALLGLRLGLGVYANLRPVKLIPQLMEASPLKLEILQRGIDLLIVRELTGGMYFGNRGRLTDQAGNAVAFDTETYSAPEIRRILEVGYEAAMSRSKRLCVVDKANVLESSRLWREVAASVAGRYPEVTTSYLYVDNCAMQLILNPSQFDVIVTSNMFGDILSDEASVLTGSIGMLPSASLGDMRGGKAESGTVRRGLYEPIHGSAPDIAGTGKANPLGTILSAAMMLRYSFNLETEAQAIEKAVETVLDSGFRTADIAGHGEAKSEKLTIPATTEDMTREVVRAV